MQVREGAELPPKCQRARLTHHHWKSRAEEIVRNMEAEGILVKVDEVTRAVSVGFFLSGSPMATASSLWPTTPASTRCLRGIFITSLHLSRSGRG